MSRRAADPLYVTDAEIAGRLGVSTEEWCAASAALAKTGLPAPDPVFRNRSYWPAVRAYLDKRAGLTQDALPLAIDGEENWTGHGSGRNARARS